MCKNRPEEVSGRFLCPKRQQDGRLAQRVLLSAFAWKQRAQALLLRDVRRGRSEYGFVAERDSALRR